MTNVDGKKVFLILFISVLLVGGVFAAKTVNDFKVDDSYKNAYKGDYYSVYLNEKQDGGVLIFKNVNDDAYDDTADDNDIYDGLIHNDGREYIIPDDDMKIDKNSDNTVNFTDYDHATHGVAEVVNCDGQEFIVVFFAKNGGSADNATLMSQLVQFNKDNSVNATAF